MSIKRILLSALFSILLCSALLAQGTTGAISGTVSDPNGAVISGAAVKVTNVATNYNRETTTGSDGIYAIQLLPPGRYQVEISDVKLAE